MIGGRKVLALIPARGGSKGLPGKNIMPVCGRPLLSFSVEAARGSRYVDRIVLSSDDEAIVAAAVACGCDAPFLRPAELATDTAATVDVVLHALDQLPGYDLVVLLQPTSPLRTAADIDAAFERLVRNQAPCCVSVSPVEQSPYWMYRLAEHDFLEPLLPAPPGVTRRQELPPVYALNGAVYIADVAWLRNTRSFVATGTVAYVMPLARAIDIDNAADFDTFKKILTESLHA